MFQNGQLYNIGHVLQGNLYTIILHNNAIFLVKIDKNMSINQCNCARKSTQKRLAPL